MKREYEEILHFARPVSERHARMSRLQRAAQFAPFAALKGYEEEIREARRVTESRRELCEEEQGRLNEALRQAIESGEETAFCYFQPDAQKAGGHYLEKRGRVRHFDAATGRLYLAGGGSIAIRELFSVKPVR